MKRILIIEDDPALGQGIRLALQGSEMELAVSECLQDAKQRMNWQDYDLILLDINLPDGNGLDFLRNIRLTSQIPVILLTANDMETDVVTGLELGADDYITKPFSLAILRARVNTQLRKNGSGGNGTVILGRFRFDFEKMAFYKDEQEINLSKTEQKLLYLLVSNRGITLSRDKLMDKIWTDGADYVEENALSVAVKRLRDKLEDDPKNPQYLKTVYGLGYGWEVK